MNHDRCRTLMHITGVIGFVCLLFALTTSYLGSAIDGYFGWATAEVVFRDVFLVGPVEQRWSGFAGITMILGLIGLTGSLALSFISKARHRKPS